MRAAKQVVDLLTNDKTVGIATCMTFLNRIHSLSSRNHIKKIINIWWLLNSVRDGIRK